MALGAASDDVSEVTHRALSSPHRPCRLTNSQMGSFVLWPPSLGGAELVTKAGGSVSAGHLQGTTMFSIKGFMHKFTITQAVFM